MARTSKQTSADEQDEATAEATEAEAAPQLEGAHADHFGGEHPAPEAPEGEPEA